MKHIKYFSIIIISIISYACPNPTEPLGDLEDIPYNPTSYTVIAPFGYPEMPIPSDNPMTKEGILLGRMLFYEPMLSGNNTQSCASCHKQELNFTDGMALSIGIDGQTGRRSAPSLLDIGWATNGLFWDGRAISLEKQALGPVTDPLEMHANWPDVIEKLKNDINYPSLFRKAFGIANKADITKELTAKAIAQFERTIINPQNSRYDQYLRGEIELTDEEMSGRGLFFEVDILTPDAECGHCHNNPLFFSINYFNNGTQEPITGLTFQDNGRGEFTGNQFDNGKFRAPTLRNIAFSAPYMHNGSIPDLEGVINHYNSGGFYSDNRDPLVHSLSLNEIQKADIIAFIMTMTDSTVLTNPEWANPFQ